MIHRWQKENLIKGLQNRRVVFISGARQCGKTTLARELVNEDIDFITLDNSVYLQAAKTDPEGFVKRQKKTLIIDEVQKAPELLSAIKQVVDENTSPGQYLLTGSANILSMSGVHESLAGRIKYIRLRPFTQGEINGVNPLYLENFFNESFKDGDPFVDKDVILSLAFKGGFPEPLRLDKEERRSWFKDYMTSLLEKDLKDISTIYRMDKIKLLLEVSASWSGKFLDINAICAKLGIQKNTLEGYLQALQTLYLVEKVSPWVNTDYERVGKKSKFYMSDCGLMARCLNLNLSETRLSPDQTGKVVETFVFNELAAYMDVQNEKYRLFQYRDREQREVDFVIERDDGAILGIEVKAGTSLNDKSFKYLEWFKAHIAKDKPFVGIILYTGNKPIKFKNGMWAVPISNLWAF